jgi:hypothetical protein
MFLFFPFVVSLSNHEHNNVSLTRRLFLMPVLAPAGEILSFASPKESIQRKGDPDAACFLRSGIFIGVCQKGHPCPSGKVRLPAAPLRAIPDKIDSARRGMTGMGALIVGWIRRATTP